MEPSPHHLIAKLRAGRGETVEALAGAIGCSSKGRISEMERGLCLPTPEQALAIERISGGTIDASAISPVIAMAREAKAA